MGYVQQVRDYLAADGTLMAYLPGGLHVGVGEISRTLTPAAFDARRELMACGLVNGGGDTPDGPTAYAGRMLVNVWLYHPTGDAALETAAARVRALLHRTSLPGIYEVRWAFDSPPFTEEALSARGLATRYEVIRKLVL